MAQQVDVTTLDEFLASSGISHLRLLKVDTEGHELAVLRGARGAITSGNIDVAQFESHR